MTDRARPLIVALVALLAGLALTAYIAGNEAAELHQRERSAVTAQAAQVRARLESEVNSAAHLSLGLVSFIAANPDFDRASFERVAERIGVGDMEGAVFNRMEAPVFSTYKNLAVIKQQILDSGCEAAAMSGSGPTMFGVCRSQQQALRVAENLKQRGVTYRTHIAALTPVGVERIA